MDNIWASWQNALKSIHKPERASTNFSGAKAKPIADGTATSIPTHTSDATPLNTVAQLDARLLEMQQTWMQTRSGPFPEGIQTTMMNLSVALVIREAEAVWNIQVAEEAVESGEKREEKRQKKDKALKKVCAKAQIVDQDSTYHMSFNWAEDVDTFVGPTHIPDKPTPSMNITSIDVNTIVTPEASIDTDVAIPPNVTPITFVTLSTHRPRDLSALRLGIINPWASIRHHHHRPYSHGPYHSIRQNQHSSVYPTNTSINISARPKLPLSTPTQVFETVMHPYGIEPTKPVFRVPVATTTGIPTDPSYAHSVSAESPPLPSAHLVATVKCHCGQLVPVLDNSQVPNILSHHTISTLVSDIVSYPLSLPAQLFSRLRFS
jgi:hypothetical protein